MLEAGTQHRSLMWVAGDHYLSHHRCLPGSALAEPGIKPRRSTVGCRHQTVSQPQYQVLIPLAFFFYYDVNGEVDTIRMAEQVSCPMEPEPCPCSSGPLGASVHLPGQVRSWEKWTSVSCGCWLWQTEGRGAWTRAGTQSYRVKQHTGPCAAWDSCERSNGKAGDGFRGQEVGGT